MTCVSIKRLLLPVFGLMLLIAGSLLSAAFAADAAGLVNALTSQLGVSQTQAEGGAGSMFNLAKQRMAPDQFGQVQNQIPGIGNLMSKAPGSGGGGVGGMASGALGSMTGGGGSGGAAGGLGSLGPLAGSFSSLGMSPDMVSKFVPVVLEYLNSSGGGGAAGLLKGALLG